MEIVGIGRAEGIKRRIIKRIYLSSGVCWLILNYRENIEENFAEDSLFIDVTRKHKKIYGEEQ